MPIEARRHSPRMKVSEAAYINFGSGNRGVVRDISDGGLGFSTTAPIQSGREIRLRLPSDDKSGEKSGDRYEVVADIAWNDDSGTRGGLRFKTVPAEVGPKLRDWMDQLSFTGVPFPGEKSEGKAPEASVPAEWTDSLEVTGLGPEVGRSRESDERVAAAAVEILAAEETSHETAESRLSSTPELTPAAQDEVNASTASSSFANFTRNVPGTKESDLTMFPPEEAPTGRHTFSYRAQQRRRNLLGVAVIILLCAVGASAAALWYVYPSQTRYEMRRAQDGISRFIPGYRSGNGQPTSNVEPAPIGSGVPDDEIAGAVPKSAPAAPDVTGTRRPDGSDPTLKTGDSAGNTSTNGDSQKTETGDNSADSDAASATEKSTEPAKNQSDTDLALARTYLGSDSTPDQKTKAVQLLWLAIEKGNVDAELQLADLYASGEDVPKSCVQARILLKAAQLANPSVAEPKLKELDQAGCS